ncbi:MAG: cell division protein FtsA [Chloroflexi bacterium]|nr:cell division protein FtsA [Chloroflexota bacterium]
MARIATFAAIDVGTTKICALVGQVDRDGELQVLGVGISPSHGMKRGMVVNVEEAAAAIRLAVERAERSSGTRIPAAYVGITGTHVQGVNNRGAIAITRPDRLVSGDEVERVLEAARSIAIPSNREVLHVLPRSYTLDGYEGVRNPVGLHGFRLDVETHIVTGAATSIQNLTKCVELAGVAVEDLVLEPLASSEAVLTEAERDMGVVLADIGGGTTDLALFKEGSICHTAVVPVGGNHFTQDLAIGLRVPFEAAEEAKIRYGSADPQAVDAAEAVEIASFGDGGQRRVARRLIAEILEARLEELGELILGDLERSGYGSLLPAGLVLAGGTANLHHIATVLTARLDLPVRVGLPRSVYGLADSVRDPAFATSVGLLRWGMLHGVVGDEPNELDGFDVGNWWSRLLAWLKDLLPQ